MCIPLTTMTRSAVIRLLPVTLALIALPQLSSAAEPLTRAQFVDTLVKEVYPHDLQRDCFTDLKSSRTQAYNRLFSDITLAHPQAKTLCLGINYGLLDGDTTGSFRPDAPINIAEASKMLAISHSVALPDSEVIRKLGWHWRYTEALKRRRVIDWRIRDYSQPVTRDDLHRMFATLRPVKPALLRPAAEPIPAALPEGARTEDQDSVIIGSYGTADADYQPALETNGRARPHRGAPALPLSKQGFHRLETAH